MRVIGYVRVSTDEQSQSGLGIAAQRQTIAGLASQRDWQVDWIEDAGFSAKDLNRPGITYALDLLKRGEAEVLVLARLDRLSRSMIDFSTVMESAARHGWSLVSVDLGVDMTTASGRLLANVFAAFAAFERELIQQRTRDALAAARRRGQRLGRPRVTDDAVVARIVVMQADGMSPSTIARVLTADHVPTTRGAAQWRASTVRRVLQGHILDQQALQASRASDVGELT